MSNEWTTVKIIKDHPAALWVRYYLIFPLSLVFISLTLTFPVIHRDLLVLQTKEGINSGRSVMTTIDPQHKVLLSLLVSAEKCKPRWIQFQSNTGLRWTREGNHLWVIFIDTTEILVPCARSHSPQGFHYSCYILFHDLPFYRLAFAI